MLPYPERLLCVLQLDRSCSMSRVFLGWFPLHLFCSLSSKMPFSFGSLHVSSEAKSHSALWQKWRFPFIFAVQKLYSPSGKASKEQNLFSSITAVVWSLSFTSRLFYYFYLHRYFAILNLSIDGNTFCLSSWRFWSFLCQEKALFWECGKHDTTEKAAQAHKVNSASLGISSLTQGCCKYSVLLFYWSALLKSICIL